MVKAVDNDGYPTPPQGMADFYQNLFEMLGFKNPYRSKIDPNLPIQEQLSHFLRRNGPVHNDLTNREYLAKYGDTSRSHVVPNYPQSSNMPNRSDEGGDFSLPSFARNRTGTTPSVIPPNFDVSRATPGPDIPPYYPAHRSVPPSYTPPENFVPTPSFMKSRPGTFPPLDMPSRPSVPDVSSTRQEPTDALQRTLLGLDTEDDTGHDSTTSYMYETDPRFIRAVDRKAGPRVIPNAAVYQATPGNAVPDSRIANMTPSTGRAHLTAPIDPSSANVPLPIPRPDDLSSTPQAQPKARPQPKPPLHDVTPDANQQQDEDTGPGSLAEAKRLFPGQKLQQAVYYTQPDRGENGGGGFKRLGVGADTSNLNPDYVAHIWEPVNMNTTQRFVRGAYETPGKNPTVYDPSQDDQQMASGGVIDAAHKIAREKATPCHTGLINMAVGGRTDYLPMHVREGSYVLPADIVSALGEGNTMAGSKVVDHMFAGHPAHKAGGGSTSITISQKPKLLESTRILPGDIETGVNGEDIAGTGLMGNMFASGPFGTSGKAPQFQSLVRPSLDEYSQMKKMFTPTIPSLQGKTQAANGGPIMSGNRRPVPIIAAGGEYVIDPDDVARYGGGDIDKGHNMLDDFVKHVRKHLVKTLSKLPGPRRD